MKKGFILLFIIFTFYPCLSNATNNLTSSSVQNRTTEKDNKFNRPAFESKDANNQYAGANVLSSEVLTDPNGKTVGITTPARFGAGYTGVTDSPMDVTATQAIAAVVLGGAISGTVYQSDGVTPLTGQSTITINVFTGSPCGIRSFVVAATVNSATGTYTISGLPAGTYYLRTWSNENYISEWWASPQSVRDCAGAQSIAVTEGQTVTGKNFQLELGGAISGTVYQSDGVTPLTGKNIGITAFIGSPCGNHTWVDFAAIDPATGTYTTPGLPAGTYYLQTGSSENYVHEWWASPQSVLNCSGAQSIVVTVGQTVTGKNFQLDLGGAISGILYQSDGVTPMTGKNTGVTAFTESPCGTRTPSFNMAAVDPATGTYTILGLPAGNYYLQTWNTENNISVEWWASPQSIRDCAGAQLIVVAEGQTVTGKNFQLDLAGAISGTVYQSDGVTPLTGKNLMINAFTGSPCGSLTLANSAPVDLATGTYTIRGLPAGTYYLRTWSQDNYISEFWASPQSVLNCVGAQTIVVTVGQTVTGKNFQLDLGGVISGTVYQSDGVTPLTGKNITINAFTGSPCGTLTHINGAAVDSATGNYTILGLPVGTNYLQTWSQDNYINEYWASPQSVRDCVGAQTIVVTVGQTVTGKNFQLDLGGAISGTVYQSDGVTPMTGKNFMINAFTGSPCGSFVGVNGTAVDLATGTYTIHGLPAGTFYLRTWSSENYVQEWWASPQSVLSCAGAQTIAVTVGQTVTGKNFQQDLTQIVTPTYHLTSFYVQNRTNENGSKLNRLAFECKDANNQYAWANVLGSVVLTDPNGKNVNLTTPVRFTTGYSTDSYFDPSNGRWIYPAPYFYSGYSTEFTDKLIAGTYHLTFTDKNGQVSQLNYLFNKIVDLPIIPSSSYHYYRDQDGNFIWQWQSPNVDPNIQTSVRAFITIYDVQGNYWGELWVKIPTNMGYLFVPKETFETLLTLGKTFSLGTHVRTDDNNNRAYSTEVPMSNLAVNPVVLQVPKDAGTTTLSVSNPLNRITSWNAAVTSGGSWFSIISGAGGTNPGNINCSFTSNTSTSARTATIRVASLTVFVDVTVTQAGTGSSDLSLVPDTGQTKCYDVTGYVITCPSPGQALYGQDANFTIRSPSYTKLDSGANALSDSVTSWAMVRDNVTGLIWEMKTNKDGVKNYNDSHDADNTYTRYDSNPATNGGYAGTPGDGTDTEDVIKALNDAHFGGYSDWRLPTIKELAFIINYDIALPGPTINTTYFPDTQSSLYWSSNNYAPNTDLAWGVYFYFGLGYDYYKSYGGYVRAVRGGQTAASGSFTDNGDGTVTDKSTSLMWQKVSSSSKTWEQALTYCSGLNLGAHTDWRLPTMKELRSLVDYSRFNPAIDTTFFPDTVSSFYWSSTSNVLHAENAWSVVFYEGDDSDDYKGYNNHVRAVRGGTAPIPPVPDIKANGQDGQITVSSGTRVYITMSLAPGDQNGKLVDMWILYNSPDGWRSLTPNNGFAAGIQSVGQYPLTSMERNYFSDLPVGDYAFYFCVDMTPNGIIDSPFYYDVVQVHVVD